MPWSLMIDKCHSIKEQAPENQLIMDNKSKTQVKALQKQGLLKHHENKAWRQETFPRKIWTGGITQDVSKASFPSHL